MRMKHYVITSSLLALTACGGGGESSTTTSPAELAFLASGGDFTGGGSQVVPVLTSETVGTVDMSGLVRMSLIPTAAVQRPAGPVPELYGKMSVTIDFGARNISGNATGFVLQDVDLDKLEDFVQNPTSGALPSDFVVVTEPLSGSLTVGGSVTANTAFGSHPTLTGRLTGASTGTYDVDVIGEGAVLRFVDTQKIYTGGGLTGVVRTSGQGPLGIVQNNVRQDGIFLVQE